jgi:hypothetical protein
LHEVEQRAIDLTQRIGRDEDSERGEGRRK